jgi:hypothetical protein
MMVVSFSGMAMADATATAIVDEVTSTSSAGINNNTTTSGTVQGQSTDVNIQFPESRDLTTTNINAKGYRGFAAPGEIPLPAQGPAYFGDATPGPQFQSMKTALIYKKEFTVPELDLMAKGCDVDVMANPLIPKPAEEDLAASIKVFLSKPAANVTLVGYVTVNTDDNDDVSVDALAKAAIVAQKMGGNAIHITAEGVKRKLESFGWGIGLANSTATMSASERTGTITSGGFGISGGKAGYNDYPWLQIFVLNVTD